MKPLGLPFAHPLGFPQTGKNPSKNTLEASQTAATNHAHASHHRTTQFEPHPPIRACNPKASERQNHPRKTRAHERWGAGDTYRLDPCHWQEPERRPLQQPLRRGGAGFLSQPFPPGGALRGWWWPALPPTLGLWDNGRRPAAGGVGWWWWIGARPSRIGVDLSGDRDEDSRGRRRRGRSLSLTRGQSCRERNRQPEERAG